MKGRVSRSTLFPYTTLFRSGPAQPEPRRLARAQARVPVRHAPDRKSTRLNSSHANISYAVFCLKKKNKVSLLIYMSLLSNPLVHESTNHLNNGVIIKGLILT